MHGLNRIKAAGLTFTMVAGLSGATLAIGAAPAHATTYCYWQN